MFYPELEPFEYISNFVTLSAKNAQTEKTMSVLKINHRSAMVQKSKK